MEKTTEGKLAMTRLTLRPIAKFVGNNIPTEAELGDLHHLAHEKCFLANSVKTEICCEPAVG
jgi:organic hydroperoxide reductase OsmC/OhrA